MRTVLDRTDENAHVDCVDFAHTVAQKVMSAFLHQQLVHTQAAG